MYAAFGDPCVEIVEERREDDIGIAGPDGIEQSVLAVVSDARFGEPHDALEGGTRRARDHACLLEPAFVDFSEDCDQKVFLVLEMAVDGSYRDSGLARDPGDAGAAIAH